MNSDLSRRPTPSANEPLEYRSLSAGAVTSLVLGLLSPLMFLGAANGIAAGLIVAPVPLVGLCIGLRSWLAIRRAPEELTGVRLAAAGVLLSAGSLLGSLGLAAYHHFTEVPEGYTRISYDMLRPNNRDRRRHTAVPADVMQLNGKRVFIRGYMRPSSQRYGLREFLLVRDNHHCCLGDLSRVKYHDLIEVHLVGPARADYQTRSVGVGGTLYVRPEYAQIGSTEAAFVLAAEYVK